MTKHSRKLLATAVLFSTTTLTTLLASAESIGISMPAFDDVWLATLKDDIIKHAKALGHTVQDEDANWDVDRQTNQVQNFIISGVDAIVVCVVDTAATQAMTRAATEAGIPIIYVARIPDTPLPEGVYYVGSDETTSGRMQAKAFAEALGGKGNVVVFQGQLGVNTTTVRTGGVEEILASYSDISVIQSPSANYQRQEAMDVMTNILTSGEKVDGVIANNDEMAIGAILSVEAAGGDTKSMIFAGIDGTGQAMTMMQEGLLDITVFHNNSAQAQKVAELADGLFRGEEVEQIQWVPFELVTPANMADYIK